MDENGNVRKMSKKKKTFFCKLCHYYTSKKSHYNRHLATRSHLRRKNGGETSICGHNAPNGALCPKWGKKGQKEYKCPKCDKKYKHSQSLWKHKKTCGSKEVDLLKLENQRLKEENKILKERSAPSMINSNNTTNNNISINVFLNEHCKNAIPMLDFIRNLKFKLHDIDPDRPASSIESLSNLIVNEIQQLEDTKRPVHCSDAKRLKFYVKDASGWVKDDDNKKIDKAIGFANTRHQGAWHAHAQAEGLDKIEGKRDDYYLKMNVAMGEWSDDVIKAKHKVKKEMSEVTNLKEAKNTFQKNIKLI